MFKPLWRSLWNSRNAYIEVTFEAPPPMELKMEFCVNEKKVREMAGRLRQAIGKEAVGHADALELVSQTLGYPNWDTLSGMLKRESRAVPPGVRVARPLTLYVEAFSCDEWAEGPSWAKVTIDQQFVDTVLELQALCTSQKLDQVSRSWFVEKWGDDGQLRLQGEDLQVGPRSWWIRARPKHADYDCETRMLDISWLLDCLQKGHSTDFITRKGDVLLYDGSGQTAGLLAQLVDEEQLDESYLND